MARPDVEDAEVAAGQHKPLPPDHPDYVDPDSKPEDGAAPEAVLLNQQQHIDGSEDDATKPGAAGLQRQSGGKDGHAAAAAKGGEAAVEASSGSGSSAAGGSKATAGKGGSGASADGKGGKGVDADVSDIEAAAVVDKAPDAGYDAAAAAKAVAAPPAEQEAHCDLTPPTRKQFWNIWVLVFTTVVREGIEAVVFLGGLGNVQLTAIPLAAFVGAVAGIGLGAFLFYTGRTVKDIKWFIIIMTVVLFFIAAGQVSIGTDSLIRAGMFGYASPWYDERPWYMKQLYDWSACCNDLDPTGTEPQSEQNSRRFFALARAIFGYQDKATFLEIMMYVSYWIIVIAIALWRWWRGSLLDADYKYHRQQAKLAKAAAARAKAEEAAADAELLALEEAKPAEVEEGGKEGREGGQEAKAMQLALEGAASSSLGSRSSSDSPRGGRGGSGSAGSGSALAPLAEAGPEAPHSADGAAVGPATGEGSSKGPEAEGELLQLPQPPRATGA